jgi:hypothetical protein
MVRAPVLALPNATDPFILDTDASDKSVGAELIQIQEGEERAVAYGSLTLTPKGPMVIGEPQKPLHLFFILRPWPVFYIFDILFLITSLVSFDHCIRYKRGNKKQYIKEGHSIQW